MSNASRPRDWRGACRGAGGRRLRDRRAVCAERRIHIAHRSASVVGFGIALSALVEAEAWLSGKGFDGGKKFLEAHGFANGGIDVELLVTLPSLLADAAREHENPAGKVRVAEVSNESETVHARHGMIGNEEVVVADIGHGGDQCLPPVADGLDEEARCGQSLRQRRTEV